jgi:hypothetical protein
VSKRSKDVKGFVPVAKRWVVGRTFAWMGRNRRLNKDYERTIASREATIKLANIALLLRRRTLNKNPKNSMIATTCQKPEFYEVLFPNSL